MICNMLLQDSRGQLRCRGILAVIGIIGSSACGRAFELCDWG
jgi:hypothetical protein